MRRMQKTRLLRWTPRSRSLCKRQLFGRGQVCARSSAFDFFESMEDPAATRSHSHEAVEARRGDAVMATHSAHLCFLPRSRGHRGQPTGAAVKRGQDAVKPFRSFCNMAVSAWASHLYSWVWPKCSPCTCPAPGTRARPVLPNTCEHGSFWFNPRHWLHGFS